MGKLFLVSLFYFKKTLYLCRMKEEKLNIFKKIGLWWKFEGQYYHKDFINGVKNLWKWFPTIWKDRDWDDSFIFDILTKKLKNQADYIGKKDRHTRAKRDAEVMMTCVRLLEKVKTEEYGIEHFDYEKSDWDFVPCEDHPGYSTLEVNRISENFDDYFKKYPRQYKRVMNGEINRFNRDITELTNDKHNIAMEIAHENHERARKLVFKMLEQNIEKWWD